MALRLLSERGVDAVPIKDIVEAAGQKNQSAVQYHFGSRGGLVSAVIQSRASDIDRLRLMAVHAALSLKGSQRRSALLRALIEPLLDVVTADADGLFYVRLSLQALQHPDFDILAIISAMPGARALKLALQEDRAEAIPEAQRLLRTRAAMQLMFAMTYEWMKQAGSEGVSRSTLVQLFARACEALLFETFEPETTNAAEKGRTR